MKLTGFTVNTRVDRPAGADVFVFFTHMRTDGWYPISLEEAETLQRDLDGVIRDLYRQAGRETMRGDRA